MVQFNLLPIVLASSIWCVLTNAQSTSLSFDEIIANNTNLTALNTALGASTFNLSDAYTTAVTLFAPNNDAISANTVLFAKYNDKQYIAHLQNLLLMHVYAEGAVFSANLTDGQVVLAANGENITVKVGETVTLFTADSNATVVDPDIVSSDGVLHQINNVLLPSFISTSLIDLTKNVDGFEIVLELLEFTGLATLVGPELVATVFAPTDAAFMALPDGALEYYRMNKGIATLLLSGHVVASIIPTQNMVDGETYVSPMETNLTISIEEVESQTLYKVNNATISKPNTLASNGIIHAIGKVLVVPGAEYPPKNKAPTTPTATPPTAPTPSSSAMTMTYFMASTTSVFGFLMMA